MNLHVDTDRLMAELHTLAAISEQRPAPARQDNADPAAAPATQAHAPHAPIAVTPIAVTRIVFTPADLEARAHIAALAADAGLTARRDAVGNTFFLWPGSDPTLPPVATGSHIDAIPSAGMYDGTVGVLGALAAVRALKDAGFVPRRSLEVILFTSEEPTRFGIGCLGSRLLSGTLTPAAARALTDPAGSTLPEVLAAAGFTSHPNPSNLETVPREPAAYAAFLELHIEQGPLLEAEGLPIGIVTAIAAPASRRILIEGEGGHAGAMLMPLRHDALTAAAELILAVEAAALEANASSPTPDSVATVGICDVFPGAVNSVPSRVTMSLDVRDIDQTRRDAVLGHIDRAAQALAARRGVRITQIPLNQDAPTTSDPVIVQAIAQACAAEGLTPRRMVSRAYHDTLFMARLAPVAMIFIPCRNGVSHRPDEYASPQAITQGVRVLAQTLASLSQ